MEIKNKEAFRKVLKAAIERRIRQFPVYFFGNILLNILLLGILITVCIIVAMQFVVALDLRVHRLYNESLVQGYLSSYGLVYIAGIISSSIFTVTLRGFLRNIHILHAIRAGHYKLGIQDYEMDHAMHFIEELPKSKEEIERIKIGLSFGRIVEMLELFHLIYCVKDVYYLDSLLLLRQNAAEAAEAEEKKIIAEKEKKRIAEEEIKKKEKLSREDPFWG